MGFLIPFPGLFVLFSTGPLSMYTLFPQWLKDWKWKKHKHRYTA